MTQTYAAGNATACSLRSEEWPKSSNVILDVLVIFWHITSITPDDSKFRLPVLGWFPPNPHRPTSLLWPIATDLDFWTKVQWRNPALSKNAGYPKDKRPFSGDMTGPPPDDIGCVALSENGDAQRIVVFNGENRHKVCSLCFFVLHLAPGNY